VDQSRHAVIVSSGTYSEVAQQVSIERLIRAGGGEEAGAEIKRAARLVF
jgi:hypothetical protein